MRTDATMIKGLKPKEVTVESNFKFLPFSGKMNGTRGVHLFDKELFNIYLAKESISEDKFDMFIKKILGFDEHIVEFLCEANKEDPTITGVILSSPSTGKVRHWRLWNYEEKTLDKKLLLKEKRLQVFRGTNGIHGQYDIDALADKVLQPRRSINLYHGEVTRCDLQFRDFEEPITKLQLFDWESDFLKELIRGPIPSAIGDNYDRITNHYKPTGEYHLILPHSTFIKHLNGDFALPAVIGKVVSKLMYGAMQYGSEHLLNGDNICEVIQVPLIEGLYFSIELRRQRCKISKGKSKKASTTWFAMARIEGDIERSVIQDLIRKCNA